MYTNEDLPFLNGYINILRLNVAPLPQEVNASQRVLPLECY